MSTAQMRISEWSKCHIGSIECRASPIINSDKEKMTNMWMIGWRMQCWHECIWIDYVPGIWIDKYTINILNASHPGVVGYLFFLSDTLNSLGCTICTFAPLSVSPTSFSLFCHIVGACSSSHPLVLSSCHNLSIWRQWAFRFIIHILIILLLLMMVNAPFYPWWHPVQSTLHHMCVRHLVMRVCSHSVVVDEISLLIICWHVDTALLSNGRTLLLLISTFSQCS